MRTTITTPSGLSVLIEELPHTYSVALGYFIGVGARHETIEQSGIAHLLEHMVFKGTRHFPTPKRLSMCVEGVGGYLDASTSHEITTFWAKVAHHQVERAFTVLTDLVRYPLLDPLDLEREKQVVIEELRGLQDSPDEWVHTLLQQSVYGIEQPLGRDIAGCVETVAVISHADLVKFWQQHYQTRSLVLSVAGNVRTDAMVAAATEAFGDVVLGEPVVPPPTRPPLPGRTLFLLERKIEQSHFCFGFPAVSFHDPDRWALEILDTYMGAGMSSQLFVTLREERGLAYDVGSYYSKYDDSGLWVVYASVQPEKLHDAAALILDVLQAVAQHGIPEADLQRTREQIKGSLLLTLEDTWAVAARNGAHWLRYGRVATSQELLAEIDAVTATSIQQVAQRVLRPETMHLAVIGPAKKIKRTRRLLEEFTV